jgi:hypothetical protein
MSAVRWQFFHNGFQSAVEYYQRTYEIFSWTTFASSAFCSKLSLRVGTLWSITTLADNTQELPCIAPFFNLVLQDFCETWLHQQEHPHRFHPHCPIQFHNSVDSGDRHSHLDSTGFDPFCFGCQAILTSRIT